MIQVMEKVLPMSARDILNLAPHVERVAAQLGITSKRAGRFALVMLPHWKCLPDEIRIKQGIAMGCLTWAKATKDKHDYVAIRNAFGFWQPTTGYLPQKFSGRGEGHPKRWICTFEFDETVPGRSLGRTWKQALKIATQRIL